MTDPEGDIPLEEYPSLCFSFDDEAAEVAEDERPYKGLSLRDE